MMLPRATPSPWAPSHGHSIVPIADVIFTAVLSDPRDRRVQKFTMVHQLFTAVPVKKTMTNNRPKSRVAVPRALTLCICWNPGWTGWPFNVSTAM